LADVERYSVNDLVLVIVAGLNGTGDASFGLSGRAGVGDVQLLNQRYQASRDLAAASLVVLQLRGTTRAARTFGGLAERATLAATHPHLTAWASAPEITAWTWRTAVGDFPACGSRA
jgi:uncharacterized protein YfiM (DUF2279 family)